MHGRLAPAIPVPGTLAPATMAEDLDRPAEIRGRFLESARVYYPGVELVADATISPQADPYLSDHHIDGLMVLPPAIALEAMARPPRSWLASRCGTWLGSGWMRPVLLPGDRETTLRICALRRPDSVETVVRYAGSDFRIDHFRALFPLAAAPRETPASPDGTPGAGTPLPVASARRDRRRHRPVRPRLFQDGPFRRRRLPAGGDVAVVPALIRGADDRPWFAGPGVHDAPGVTSR